MKLFVRIASSSLLISLIFKLPTALARAGGGDSYSGGSDSGSSGGIFSDSSYDDLLGEFLYYFIRFLFELTFSHPFIGLPVNILILFGIYLLFVNKGSSIVPREVESPLEQAPLEYSPENKKSELKIQDPSLSEVLFGDYVYSLYTQLQEARGRRALKEYGEFASDAALAQIDSVSPLHLTDVKGVIVGSCTLRSTLEVTAEFFLEANYIEITSNEQKSWYTKERWQFSKAGTPSIPTTLSCAGCGSSAEPLLDGSCPYCGRKNLINRYGFVLEKVLIDTREARGPVLTSTVKERGTINQTIFHPLLSQNLQSLKKSEAFQERTFLERVESIFLGIQDAWSSREWEKARPFESDLLFQSHRYWIEEYKKQNLENVLNDLIVTNKTIVKVLSDPFYDAITVRIFAQVKDSTVSVPDGKLICGDPNLDRTFSEYWTFIRKRGKSSANMKPENQCPNCGAALKISMAGLCEYCTSKITSGDFDWIASKIEQDDSYQ